jgi:hypothetical protein
VPPLRFALAVSWLNLWEFGVIGSLIL